MTICVNHYCLSKGVLALLVSSNAECLKKALIDTLEYQIRMVLISLW